MDSVEQIRGRLSIEDVVAPYVQLKKSGRSLKGLCPFHNEKTPSFIVSPDKGLAYCFGCRKGGDIFAFVQEIERVSFPESLKILADKAGIVLEKDPSFTSKEEKNILREILEDAHDFFHSQLQKTPEAISYLENRGYERSIVDRLGLGYSPDGFHELTSFLSKKSYSVKDILDSGLATQKEMGSSSVYDRFRHRIMFPIRDHQGNLVGFGGRTLSKDPETPKYLNSPETKLYHKGRMLYLFSEAKNAFREKDRAIVVEGYFDALTAHKEGYFETVASLGTALTEEQIKSIARLTKHLFFAFDADNSGQNAASRSIAIAQSLGLDPKVIHIPSGKDPDEALRSAPEEWEKAIENAPNALDYELGKAFEGVKPSSLDGKKTVLERFFPILARIPSAVTQEYYLKEISARLDITPQGLLSEFSRSTRPLKISQPEKKEEETKPSFSRFEHLMGIFMVFQQFQEPLQRAIKQEFLEENEQSLYKKVVHAYNAERSQHDDLEILKLFAEEHYASFSPQQLTTEVQTLTQGMKQQYKKRRLHELRMALGKGNTEKLLQETQDLLADRF